MVIPHKLTQEGKFLSFALPHFFQHRKESRTRRELQDAVNYGILLNGISHQLQLWPNHDFVSPEMIVETRFPKVKVQQRQFRDAGRSKLCHFTGKIKGDPNSRVAISTCDGLVGEAGVCVSFIV